MLRSKIFSWAAVGVGSVSLILGILALTLIPNVIDHAVEDRTYLGYETVNGTRQLNNMTLKWLHPPYDMQIQIWMYDIVNEADVLKGKKPRVNEIGPFTFREIQEKNFYEFADNETIIFYRNTHRYVFNQSGSCAECSLKKRVTIPNIIFQKFVDFALSGTMAKLAIEAALIAAKKETPYITVTVGEALFEGYHDPILTALCDKPFISTLCRAAKIPERIGFFYGQNNTDDGLYEVSTGLHASWKMGKVSSWNNMTILPQSYWDNEQARMISGTDGQTFPPFLKVGEPLHLFAAQACRSVWMEYRKLTVFRDIPAYRYGIPKEMYDPSLPENFGFCNKNNTPVFFTNTSVQIPGCLPAGLLDISRCQPGEPRVYLSQAHFLNAAHEVHDMIDGIAKPSPINDDTVVDIEPTSGAPINAKRVMQVNIGMKKGNLDILKNTFDVIIPVLWLNETAIVDNETRDELVNELVKAKNWAFAAGLAFIFIGVFCWLGFIGLMVVQNCLQPPSDEEEAPLVDDQPHRDEVVEQRYDEI